MAVRIRWKKMKLSFLAQHRISQTSAKGNAYASPTSKRKRMNQGRVDSLQENTMELTQYNMAYVGFHGNLQGSEPTLHKDTFKQGVTLQTVTEGYSLCSDSTVVKAVKN